MQVCTFHSLPFVVPCNVRAASEKTNLHPQTKVSLIDLVAFDSWSEETRKKDETSADDNFKSL